MPKILRNGVVTAAACVVLLSGGGAWAAPKYGPDAKPLSAGTNAAYFRENPAPDFWRLIPYYLPQETGSGCSAANFTMVLNAARATKPLSSDDKLVTFRSFAEDYSGDAVYGSAILGRFSALKALFQEKRPFANPNLARVLKNGAAKLGLLSEKSRVELVVVDQTDRAGSRAAFEKALLENERSAADFIVFSFLQGRVTGDPEGPAHVATVGAFDVKTRSVLVLDPDREWYEPYWTSVDVLFEAIADPASDSEKKAGWIVFKP